MSGIELTRSAVTQLSLGFISRLPTSAWLVVVFVLFVLLYLLYRKSRFAFCCSVGVLVVVVGLWLSLVFKPWWPVYHVLSEVRPLVSLDSVHEYAELIFHFSALLLTPLVVWMVRPHLADPQRHGRRRIEIVLAVSVVCVVVVDSAVAAHLIHEVAAQEARDAVWDVTKVTNNLLASHDETSGDETAPLIIRDQAITKIVSQIHRMVWADFPELGSKAVSLHMDGLTRLKDKVWTVVQIGREIRRPSLELGSEEKPGSLAAAAILQNRRTYCPDIHSKSKPADCRYYDLPEGGEQNYTRIACFPLSSGNQNQKPFAAICVDGNGAYPWDGRLNELQNEVVGQASGLVGLLQPFLQDDACVFGDSTPKPTISD